jgi:hypothetical protein
MTAPSPDQAQFPIDDINLWLEQQRAALQADEGMSDLARRNHGEALDYVGRGVGRLATGDTTTVSVFDVMSQVDESGAFTKILKGQTRGDQQVAYRGVSKLLINALTNPQTDFFPVIALEKERLARERLEAERPALIAEALKAAGQTPQIHLTDNHRTAEFGPNTGSNSHRYEPWSMFKTFSGKHHNVNVGEAVAFTPSRTSHLVEKEAGRHWGRKQYAQERVYEQARINGEPAVDIHYMFDPDFNSSHRVPGYENKSASYRITVPQSIAERLRESGPAAFRGILDQLVLQWASNGRPLEFRENWTERVGSARPPYDLLGEHWSMTVFDAMDKPAQEVVAALGEKGDRAPIADIYTLSRIPAGSDQAPPRLS